MARFRLRYKSLDLKDTNLQEPGVMAWKDTIRRATRSLLIRGFEPKLKNRLGPKLSNAGGVLNKLMQFKGEAECCQTIFAIFGKKVFFERYLNHILHVSGAIWKN